MKISEILGYCGMVTINLASIIPITLLLLGKQNNLSLIIIACLTIGLFLLLIRSIAIKDRLYTINNSIGLVLNGFLLTLIQ
jgi:hypothetical protein